MKPPLRGNLCCAGNQNTKHDQHDPRPACRKTSPVRTAHDNLGDALLQLNRTDEAFAEFQAASQVNPRDPMSHTNMGAYFQEHGHLSQAMEQYKTTISLTSDPGLLALLMQISAPPIVNLPITPKPARALNARCSSTQVSSVHIMLWGRLLESEARGIEKRIWRRQCRRLRIHRTSSKLLRSLETR